MTDIDRLSSGMERESHLPANSAQDHQTAERGDRPGTGEAPDSGAARDRLLGDSLIYFFGRAVPAALTLAAMPVFVRALGTQGFGSYSLYASLAMLVGNTAGAWLGQSVLRYGSRASGFGSAAFHAALHRGSVLSIWIAAVVTFTAGLLFRANLGILLVAVAAAMTVVVFGVEFAKHQAMLHVKRANNAEFVRTAITVGVPLALLSVPALRTPTVLLVGIVLGNLGGLALLRYPARSVPDSSSAWRTQVMLRNFWAFGGPIAGWILASTLLNVSDRYLIEWLVDTSAVGTYAAIYDAVFKGVTFVLTPVILASHPTIMSTWNRGDLPEVQRVLRRALAWVGLGGLAATIIAWAGASQLTTALLGHSDPMAEMLVAPIALGATLWQFAMLVHKPLELRMQTTVMLQAVAVALLCNLASNVILIPIYGYVVAAYTTVLGAGVYLGMVLIRWARLEPSGVAVGLAVGR